jgi:hypothetical protein
VLYSVNKLREKKRKKVNKKWRKHVDMWKIAKEYILEKCLKNIFILIYFVLIHWTKMQQKKKEILKTKKNANKKNFISKGKRRIKPKQNKHECLRKMKITTTDLNSRKAKTSCAIDATRLLFSRCFARQGKDKTVEDQKEKKN